jgi:hypothetical protein
VTPVPGLPTIPDPALPAAVRGGDDAAKQSYRAALGFEQVMLGELVRSMVPQDSPLSEGPYGDAVQQALTGSLISGGGTGLGRQLFAMMQETRA